MAQYKNATKGVMNIEGAVVAPGQTFESDDKHPGIKRMLDRKVLLKVDGRTGAAKQESKTGSKSE